MGVTGFRHFLYLTNKTRYIIINLMSDRRLPTLAEALASLCSDGDQFSSAPLAPRPLGDLTYTHPKKGERPVKADNGILRATGKFYTSNRALRCAIRKEGGRVVTFSRLSLLTRVGCAFANPRPIWGISGFATPGFNCEPEAAAMSIVFQHFASTDARMPQLIVDGAAGAGVLGISGVLAQQYDIPTLSVSPLQGLSTMAPRGRVAIFGHTYKDREIIIGMLADILLCVGGGEGAKREALTTLACGGVVLLVAIKNDGPHTLAGSWQQAPELVAAERAGRLVVCSTIDELPQCLERVIAAAASRYTSRRRRFRGLARRLRHS